MQRAVQTKRYDAWRRSPSIESGTRRAKRTLCGVAPTLLLLATPTTAAPATCIREGNNNNPTVTCSGDQSAGIGNADLRNSRPPGSTPPAPPFPNNPQTIGVLVRNLDRDIAVPAGATGIRLTLGRGASPLPDAALDLDIDLGGRRIDAATRPGASGVLADLSSGDIDLDFRNGRIEAGFSAIRLATETGSITARLDGTLTSTATTTGTVQLTAGNSINGRDDAGTIDLTIARGSALSDAQIQAPLIGAVAESGRVGIDVEAGTTLVGGLSSDPLQLAYGIRGRTATEGAAGLPGDIAVSLAGSVTMEGREIPGVSIEIRDPGSVGIAARATRSGAAPTLEGGAVRVTTGVGSSILTTEASSPGIVAESSGKNIAVVVDGGVTTRGEVDLGALTLFPADLLPLFRESAGVVAVTESAAQVSVRLGENGEIDTSGTGADGVRILSAGQIPTIPGLPPRPPGNLIADIAGAIDTTGAGAAGVRARVDDGDDMTTAVGDVTVTVREGASIGTHGSSRGSGAALALARGVEASSEDGDVSVTVGAAVTTGGEGADAIAAATETGDVTATLTATGRLTTTGAGADALTAQTEGGDVTINIAGDIDTTGAGAAGVRARVDDGDDMTTAVGDVTVTVREGASIGTHGSSRGSGAALTLARGIEASSEDGDVTVTVGAVVTTGGEGADALAAATETGDVTATLTATGRLTTTGAGADAVTARTEGGEVTINIAGDIDTTGAGAAGLRARVDDGDDMTTAVGDVTVTVREGASIGTHGSSRGSGAALTLARGVEASSEDGDVTVTIGAVVTTVGQGADALAAATETGDVTATLTATGRLATTGAGADAVTAQTQGGDVTINIAGELDTTGAGAAGVRARVDDGDDTMTAVGDVTVTVREGASIGTHGSSRGSGAALTLARGVEASSEDGDVTVTVGAVVTTGGEGADALAAATETGDVTATLTATGRLTTTGAGADALTAQTEGGDVTINIAGELDTTGAGAAGVRARVDDGDDTTTAVGDVTVTVREGASIGTHGSSRGSGAALTLARGVEASSEDGDVTVTIGAVVTTVGQGADALAAATETGDVTATLTATGRLATTGAGADAVTAQTEGGDVTINIAGELDTTGAGAAGLRARVDDGDDTMTAVGDVTVTVREGASIGTHGSSRGSGAALTLARGVEASSEDGDVTVTVGAPVTTGGEEADALAAMTETGDVTTTLTATGRLTTTGAGADAVTAQTEGGDVTINIAGEIDTTGARADGVSARSGGNASLMHPAVDLVVSGTVHTAGEGSAAVRASAPSGQRLSLAVARGGRVEGTTAVAFSESGPATQGPATGIQNLISIAEGGSLLGSLELGAGADFLDNAGTLSLRGRSQFGAGEDRLRNTGTLLPGGEGQIEEVSVWGLEQVEMAPQGVLVFEFDGTVQRADSLQFASESGSGGATVTLDGTVEIRELRGDFRVGERRFTVLRTDGDLRRNPSLVVRTPETAANAVLQQSYGLENSDTELILVQRTEGDFSPPEAGDGNAREVAEELGRLAEREDVSEEIGDLLSELGGLERGSAYRGALNRLHPEPYDAMLQGSWYAERAFVDQLWEDCPPTPRDHCAWGGVFGRATTRNSGEDRIDFSEYAVGPRGGVGLELGSWGGWNWELRAGAAYEHVMLDWRGPGGGRGDRVLGGVSLRGRDRGNGNRDRWRLRDGLEFGVALAAGGTWYQTERRVELAGTGNAEAEPRVTLLGGHARVAWRFGSAPHHPGWYARLGLEVGAVALRTGAFSEDEGAGVTRLRVAATRETYTSLRPLLELGTSLHWGGLRIAPHGRLGLTHLVGGADSSFRARLVAAPPGGEVVVRGDTESNLIEASGGLQLSLLHRASLGIGYTGRTSPDGTNHSHEGWMRVEFRF